MSNRSTGSAVFASWEIDEMGSYGDCVFQIDLGAMKADGYTPDAGGESPLEEIDMQRMLASLIGVEDFYPEESLHSDGISEDTVVIHGNIPPKYLTLVAGKESEDEER